VRDFCPENLRDSGDVHHGNGHFENESVPSLRNSILRWTVGDRLVVSNAALSQKVLKFDGAILASIVGSDSFDFSTKFILDERLVLVEFLESFQLLSHHRNGTVTRVVISKRDYVPVSSGAGDLDWTHYVAVD
jgi:hypothetical protein